MQGSAEEQKWEQAAVCKCFSRLFFVKFMDIPLAIRSYMAEASVNKEDPAKLQSKGKEEQRLLMQSRCTGGVARINRGMAEWVVGIGDKGALPSQP